MLLPLSCHAGQSTLSDRGDRGSPPPRISAVAHLRRQLPVSSPGGVGVSQVSCALTITLKLKPKTAACEVTDAASRATDHWSSTDAARCQLGAWAWLQMLTIGPGRPALVGSARQRSGRAS